MIMKNKQVKISLKQKLLLATLPLTLVLVVGLLIFSYTLHKNSIITYSKEILQAKTDEKTKTIENEVGGKISILESIGQAIEENGYSKNYIESLSGSLGLESGIYLCTLDGEYMDSTGYIPEVDPKTRDWYKEGREHKEKFELGQVYKDVDTGKQIVTASRTLKDGTIICADIFLDELSKEISETKVLDNGKVLLMDKTDNSIIAYENTEYIGNSIQKFNDFSLEEAIKNSSPAEVGEYTVESKDVEGTNWALVSFIQTDILLSDLDKTITRMFSSAILCMIIIGGLQWRLLSTITKPVQNVTNALTDMISGDLTIEVETRSNDELGLMANTLRKYSRSMREKVGTFISTSNTLKQKSKEGNLLVDTLQNEAMTQSQSMSELKETMTQIATSVSDVAESTVSLSESMEECSELGDNINERVSSTIEISNASKIAMNELDQVMRQIKQSTNTLELNINTVIDANKEMKSIIELIKGIAEQTNLLSLNASIESARAGEAGKGFSVVANEIRKLAERSNSAVDDITELINNINNNLNDTSEATRESVECVNSSKDVVTKTLETFEKIINAVEMTGKNSKIIKEKIASCTQIATNIAAISEEQSAGVEEVLATVETLTESANSIAVSSDRLKDDSDDTYAISETLYNSVQDFKVE